LQLSAKTILMIRYNELKEGDFVIAEYEGKQWEGVVNRLDVDQQQACVETEVQEFWFTPEHLFPIPISEKELFRLNFQKEEQADGSVRYMKGPFRLEIKAPGDFSDLRAWYREDIRHWNYLMPVHELQNHYLAMTKMPLTRDVMV
jgi:hypothetical protein